MRRWWEKAACVGASLDLFFPRGGDRATVKAAKAYCEECPVIFDCLQDSLTSGLRWEGIRGGLTETERRKLYTQNRRRTTRVQHS